MERRAAENAYKKRQRDLYGDMRTIKAVRKRDGNYCRYCGKLVNWDDRKSVNGGTYDHVNPDGDNSVENIVVACRSCNSKKSNRTPEQAKMQLLPLDTGPTNNTGRFQADNRQISGKNNLHLPNRTVPNSTIPNQNNNNKRSAPDGANEFEIAPAEKPQNGGAQVVRLGKGEEYTPEFERFWTAYPRKVEKIRAFKAWKARIKEKFLAEDMIAAADNYAEHCANKGTEKNFIKHPATFIGANKPFLDWIRAPDEQVMNVPKAWNILKQYLNDEEMIANDQSGSG
ncbi:MAG: HNH endonuclease domain-containing protein [Desulfotomaculaceae bacterium]|nr:HNH endonuclease domain-containing protein [Desulfotomaculaceae bacterium]